MGQCYGFFEIPSVTAAIDAVDIMCKTADVEMITWEKKLGGRLVTIIIRGDDCRKRCSETRRGQKQLADRNRCMDLCQRIPVYSGNPSGI